MRPRDAAAAAASGSSGTTQTGATTGPVTTSGGASSGDADAGSIIWVTEGCNNCHKLGGNPATSIPGPNFDDNPPDRATILEVTKNGKGTMPGFGRLALADRTSRTSPPTSNRPRAQSDSGGRMEYSRPVRVLPVLLVLLTLARGGLRRGLRRRRRRRECSRRRHERDRAAAGQADARARATSSTSSRAAADCHALADTQSGEIGRGGVIGPDLDEVKPSFDLIVDRVTNGKGKMPAFDTALTPLEIRNVAAYVSSVAGK